MKAQLIGQVFIYIITIIIVAFILVYGYRAIFIFKEKADQISFVQLKNDLQNTVEVLSVDFGSVKIRRFTVPENINTVCFVKTFPSMPTLSGTNYPIIEDSVNSGVNKNVFLVGKNVEESFFIGKISLDEDLLCVSAIGNEIELKMEGRGDHTFISSDR